MADALGPSSTVVDGVPSVTAVVIVSIESATDEEGVEEESHGVFSEGVLIP